MHLRPLALRTIEYRLHDLTRARSSPGFVKTYTHNGYFKTLKTVPGWNFYDNNSNTSDVYGHGTLVAGVVTAQSNNGLGVTSVAWNAKLMPIRISDSTGYASWSAAASGLTWAADHGAKVANISYMVQGSSTVKTAAQYVRSKGGVVVAAAGNTGAYDSTPASDVLLSVAATDSADNRASWSTYGPYVDLSAPAVGIWSTTSAGGYFAVSGTSVASPLTAGVAALMFAANPALGPADIGLVRIFFSSSPTI